MSRAHAPTNSVPVIESARLRLRGHRLGDLDDCAAMWSDTRVTRFIGGRPFSREEVWARMLRHVGHWALQGFGFWVIEEKISGRFIGEAGFADFKRDMEPSLEDTPEIGWALAPGAQGKGYGSEAASTVLDWGDAQLGAAGMACLIHPENAASIRIAEKCGFEPHGRTVYRGQPAVLFRRG